MTISKLRLLTLSILCAMTTSLVSTHLYAQDLDATRASQRTVAQAQFRELVITPPEFARQTTQRRSHSAIPLDDLDTQTSNRLFDEIDPIKKSAQPEKDKNTPQRSRIEDSYAERILDAPNQFGYDFFDQLGTRGDSRLDLIQKLTQKPFGSVSEDYVLGVGDQIQIVFQGELNTRDLYNIDTNGLIVIENLGPILAAGRPLSEFRNDLEGMVSESLTATKTFVSLHSLKQISVLVMGNVKNPGRQDLVHYNSLLDALSAAGGIKKDGTLRHIKLVRDGQSRMIDLYDFLLDGLSGQDIPLRGGDRIIVPAIGPTIAVYGDVKRPAIFELKSKNPRITRLAGTGAAPISLSEALFFGGGVTAPGYNRFIKISPDATGFETIRELTETTPKIITPGSIIQVTRGESVPSGQITLSGHVRSEGIYGLDDRPTLSKLLTGTHVFKDNVYPLIGIIERVDPKNLTRKLIAFPPIHVTQGSFDLRLEDQDQVTLFSTKQIRTLMYQFEHGTSAQNTGFSRVSFNPQQNIDEHMISPREETFLLDTAISARGAITYPGLYPAAEGITLKDILDAAGGLSAKANKNRIEVTSALLGEGTQEDGRSGTQRNIINIRETRSDTIELQAGDTILVPKRFIQIAEGDSVYIGGEVQNPGKYDLVRGETLLSLIERAGGLTNQAYPPGAIFSRERERKREESQFKAAARELERALASAIEQDKEEIDSNQIRLVRELSGELRNIQAVGRITVEADPAVLATDPLQDILLEAGDKIYMPKRPLTVRVNGEVLSPAALQFRSEKTARDYIHEAGGTTYFADKSRGFVLFPDGSSQPLNMGRWSTSSSSNVMIPPGSTIVMPRDPKPFDFIQTARDFTQILTNVAITGIFLDDIADDN